ncbi:5'-nucleotidase C-terminal domain-containing protein [Oceanobacillus polygoni]|uniref:LPXTG-motif cell wall-anchored protein n=1 Tax=Oceanobacillus polygoni TaxID=1235259 RepID=A0A9X0YWY8_9BACI|nr:5'-nucleotidase C-terminal domain-containing protein [Oceanobacillus polygoni]MBP2080167.1 LPXTG-motif cell wall-anchored protein [Oceanobacillus polygoni]
MKSVAFRRVFSMFLILVMLSVNITPGFVTTGSAQSDETTAEDLFISEYIEGSSFNKAIEIYNGTGSAVDLSSYQVELYSNGASSASQTLTLSGTLENNDVIVLAHPSADQAILDQADEENGSVINFNGDDVLALTKDNTLIDVLGEIGVRDNFAADVTLVRDASITAPSETYNQGQWNDYAINTFAYLGSHTMDGAGEIDPPEEPVDPDEVSSIGDARELSDGTNVTVEGIVTVDNAAISNGAQFTTYIQDETGGINLFSYEQGDLPDLVKGDRVQVVGELASYNGLKEVVPTSIEVLESDQALPEAQSITLEDLQDPAIAESYEGQLVQVNGYISTIPGSPAGGGYNISLVDAEFNGTTLRVMENALDISQVEAGLWYDITAIVSQYNTYQLIPTGQGDLQVAADQPEPPTSAGYYETTVESVTDGDTIRVATPVFGETRVRFLNMDTAETYAAKNKDPERAEINENQKYYGDLATDYIQELIQPGDEIYLKVGDEPTDDYGRILAEVIRKEDQLNINLEMVEAGYASTYFLAPVDEEAYPMYQQAVKEAKDAGLGIWNPENPLLELPFAFRANDDQKGFLRYVGNSETMEYVEPNSWEDVPVDKLIFFTSEEEAESYGYTPFTEEEAPNEDVLELQLLSLNDLHGKIDQEYSLDPDGDGVFDMYGRMDYTAAAMKEREQENEHTLIVHAGDMIGGSSPISGLLQDEPTVEIMEAIGFDVGTVGNHEFDEGLDELLRMVNGGDHPEGKGTEGYAGMSFPVLCANCVYDDTGEPFLDPYHIAEVDGVEVGFIGVNTVETVNMVMPASLENVAFTDETEAVNAAAAELTDQGVEAIIVLAHLPAYQTGDVVTGAAADLANNIDDAVDVIFSGHNHVVNNAVVDDKLIVQASEYGKAFADVDLVIDRETGDIIEKEAEVVFVKQSDYTADEEVAGILDTYAERIAPIINEVIGYNAQDLTGSYTNDGDHGLGNLLADAMNWSMESDFAMMNGGGIRDSLLAGEVTWGNLYNIQPFGNTLMTFEVTGADLYPIINEQLSPIYGPDYSIAGLHYIWNKELNEVVTITFPDGTPIDEDAVYTLTVNNYMGTSDGPIKDLGKNPIMGPEDIEATVDFVKHLNSTESNPIVYGAEGRITETDEVPGAPDPEEPGNPGENPDPEDPKDPETPGDDDKDKEQPGDSDKTITVKPIVQKNQATLADDALDTIAENGIVIIDLNESADLSMIEIVLSSEQVKELKAKNAVLLIEKGDVSLEIPASVFTNGDEAVAIVIERLDAVADALSNVYDFAIIQGDQRISEFEDAIILTFQVDATQVGNEENMKLFYLNEADNRWKVVGGNYENGKISAGTNHFSTFAVFELEASKDDEDEKDVLGNQSTIGGTNGSNGSTNTGSGNVLPNTATNTFNYVILGVLFILIGAAIYLVKRKKIVQ